MKRKKVLQDGVITFLAGNDLLVQLMAAVVQVVSLPVPQEHFAASQLRARQTRFKISQGCGTQVC